MRTTQLGSCSARHYYYYYYYYLDALLFAALRSMTVGDVARELLCGTLGGSVGCVAGHPLDVVKHRMQSGRQFATTAQCVALTWQREGVRGFYKGLMSPLFGVGAYQAVCFASYDWAARQLQSRIRRNGDAAVGGGGTLGVRETVLAGTFSGLCTVIVTAPTDHVKIQLALQTESITESQRARYTSSYHCARVMFAQGGVRALYRGFVATLCRDIPSTAAYFAGNFQFWCVDESGSCS